MRDATHQTEPVACIFCQRTKKLSREHLWPQWVLGLIEKESRPGNVPHSIEPHDRDPRRFLAPLFSATLKAVCEDCNNGWMSDIEAEAKPYAAPLITGEEGQLLDLDAQWALARWAYLKVLLLERVDKRQRLLPPDRYRVLYDSLDDPVLPSTASIFIAAHDGDLYGQYQHRGLTRRGGSKVELFVGTFTVGHLVLQVIENVSGDPRAISPEREKEIAGHDERIWLFRPPFTWPPGLALTDSGLAVFAGPTP